jgi:hypothetical protein
MLRLAPQPRTVGIDAARSAKYHPQAEHVILILEENDVRLSVA